MKRRRQPRRKPKKDNYALGVVLLIFCVLVPHVVQMVFTVQNRVTKQEL